MFIMRYAVNEDLLFQLVCRENRAHPSKNCEKCKWIFAKGSNYVSPRDNWREENNYGASSTWYCFIFFIFYFFRERIQDV